MYSEIYLFVRKVLGDLCHGAAYNTTTEDLRVYHEPHDGSQ
jgi:hypothetical protein